MPVYQYKSLLKDGSKKSDYIETLDVENLYNILDKRNEMLLFYKNVEDESMNLNVFSRAYHFLISYFSKPRGEKLEDFLIILCQKIIQLHQASFSIIEIFNILGLSETNIYCRDLLFKIKFRLLQGVQLSQILKENNQVFPLLWSQMTYAGEQSGSYDLVLKELYQQLVIERDLKKELKSACLYPLSLLGLIVVMIFLISHFLIPELSGIFLSFGKGELPVSTQILVKISNFLQIYGLKIMGIICITLIIFWALARRFYYFRFQWDKIMFHIPIFGPLLEKMTALNFLITFSFFLKNSIHLIKSLENATDNISNIYFQNECKAIIRDILNGQNLSQACSNNEFLSYFWISLIQLGEKTGNLGDLIFEASRSEKQILIQSMSIKIKSLKPILISVSGLILIWIIFATIFPIYDHLEEFLYS